MDIAVDRRRFLIAGSAALATVAGGSAWLWWESTDAPRTPADDAVRIVAGADHPSIAAPTLTPPQAILSDVPAAPDRDTEARLSRLMEEDAANSRQRMRERQERRSDAPPPMPAAPGDPAPPTWAP